MHRVNIVYTANTQARFDWAHYINNHLALACGISSRHAPIRFCDVDKPLRLTPSTNDTVIAICSVYFDDLDTQDRFRHFFANEHPDSKLILADEPNYTDITPTFNAGIFETQLGKREQQPVRLRVLHPWVDGFDTQGWNAQLPALIEALALHNIEVSCVENDWCRANVAANSQPHYAAVLSLYSFEEAACAELSSAQGWEQKIKHALGDFSHSAQLSLATIEAFDLQRCQPYLDKMT